ncbi:OmpP1/FadL family transporter [Sulfurimonas sp.]|uniref:OmpP1/FadL family transporter n=1 Tax=Sulfurimonas sp. TaxID=2022749 RepID=UPI002B47E7D3|nr:outer membrane protein transport protein [Sulfurimonas sp.]
MKRTIKLAVVATLTLGATSVFATNGSNLIGTGAKARGMGGTAIGVTHGAESGLTNAALITSVKGTEISFGGTIFMPNVERSMRGNTDKSTADMNVIPSVSIANKANDNFYWGIGMWGTAGMGVDYRDDTAAGTYNMVTNLQLMQFGVPLAYTTNNFSVGLTPLLQYGSLDIDYNSPSNRHSGVSQDLQFGYNLGLSYEISSVTIGAIYKSEIEMEYKGQLTSAGSDFGLTLNDKLSTPAELGIGVSYNTKEHTVALDYKQIKWSSASGYEDFAWDDQSVISIGYEYATTNWAARIGYNYSASPISEQDVTKPGGYSKNALNLLGFPAIVESHITLGGTYNVNKTTSIDLAYTYAPEVSEKFAGADGGGTFDVETKHSQTALSLGLNYTF